MLHNTTNAVTQASPYNEILKQYLITALEKTGNVLDKSVDMIMEQAPILIQEILHWYFAYNLFLTIAGALLIVFTLYAGNYTHNKIKNLEWDEAFYISYIIHFFIIFSGAMMMNLQWLKILIAPRLWLIEFAARLVK